MATERTLCIIKPDAVEKNTAGAVLALLESADAAPEDNFVANIGMRLAQRTPTQPAHAA